MTQRKITPAQRFGVWKVWNGECFWCREPVLFADCHIDHVIPLAAVNSPSREVSVRQLYALDKDFDFDFFGNWVPAHSGCNQRKGFTLVNPAPAFTIHLDQVRTRSLLALRTAERIEQDGKKASLVAKISNAVIAGEITQEEIEQLFANLPVFVKKSADDMISFLEADLLLITPNWEVVSVDGKLVSVKSASGRYGVTSSSNHHSWICSQCGRKGPWSGVLCLSCGNREEPE